MEGTRFLFPKKIKKTFGFLFFVFFAFFNSYQTGAQSTDSDFFEYASQENEIGLMLPRLVYGENADLPPQRIKILEDRDVLLIGSEKNKLLNNGKFYDQFAPPGTIKISVRNGVTQDQIESVVKTWTDESCRIYEIKKPFSKNRDFQNVIFGPADKSKRNDASQACVPNMPLFVKYSPEKKKLVKIELGSQDCVFSNPQALASTACLVDLKIIDSFKLRAL